MKYFAFILSVYVLVLTAIPCVDVPKDNTVQKIELTNSTSEHHEHTTDLCSPFCTCDCCASPILNNSTIHFTCTPIAQKIITGYNNSFVSSLFASIWQPPKLS
ncbi:MAG: hypothetical protein IPO21_15780 [Bacteroidales bacterium]|nr:hypothetical protein [Bacteroidales bacterium]